MLLLGHFGPDDELLKETVEAIASHPLPLLAYFAFTIAVAGIAGRLSHEFKKDHPIGACLLDQRELVMEEWANFFNLGANSYALVTAVVDMGGKAYLFLGILKKLHFDPATAELDRIELEQVAKRPIEPREKPRDNGQQQWLWSGAREDAEESIQKYEPVFGNQFMLRMSEIKTLNVVYIDNASWQESTNSN